jgi:hypothetical protein
MMLSMTIRSTKIDVLSISALVFFAAYLVTALLG